MSPFLYLSSKLNEDILRQSPLSVYHSNIKVDKDRGRQRLGLQIVAEHTKGTPDLLIFREEQKEQLISVIIENISL